VSPSHGFISTKQNGVIVQSTVVFVMTGVRPLHIVRFIKAQRIKWLGHIQIMDQARPTTKLLDWKPMGNRPVGRSRQRWQDDVMEDLKKLKVKRREGNS
jgi:hypothetical protein